MFIFLVSILAARMRAMRRTMRIRIIAYWLLFSPVVVWLPIGLSVFGPHGTVHWTFASLFVVLRMCLRRFGIKLLAILHVELLLMNPGMVHVL